MHLLLSIDNLENLCRQGYFPKIETILNIQNMNS